MEHNAERGTAPPQRLQISFEHRGSVVTAMQWNISSSKIYIGDDKGRVSVISVSTSRPVYLNSHYPSALPDHFSVHLQD
ncbi:hermansky-Pudlak syndrome 5 protein [Trichonephila clavipes]|nr:hermansky-Pudlak syndrome 5 protein [Trichonephila clavipes]